MIGKSQYGKKTCLIQLIYRVDCSTYLPTVIQLQHMWNVLTSNRLIEKRRKQQAQRKHINALNKIKSMIDNHTPNQYSFLYTRPKVYQKKQERQADIENQNTILIEKMIRTTSDMRQKKEILRKPSLNQNYRDRVSRQIDDGNQKMVKRLQSAKSQYSTVQKSIKEYQKYKSNIQQLKMDPYYDLEHQSSSNKAKKIRPASAKR